MNTLYVKTMYFVTEQAGLFLIYIGGYPSPHILSSPQNKANGPSLRQVFRSTFLVQGVH